MRHYLDLPFYDDRVVGRAVDQSGRPVDSFTIDVDLSAGAGAVPTILTTPNTTQAA